MSHGSGQYLYSPPKNPIMPVQSDLLDFFRLPAECWESHVIHGSNSKDRKRSVERIKKEDRWDNVKRIGHGSYGEVWLQRTKFGAERAVKKLAKFRMEESGIDYKRELYALAKFNNLRVSSYSPAACKPYPLIEGS